MAGPHSERAQSPGRRALMTDNVPGRMETPPPGGPTDLESVLGCTGRADSLLEALPMADVLFPDREDPQH